MGTLRTFEELQQYLLDEEALKTLNYDELWVIIRNNDYYIKPSKRNDFLMDINSLVKTRILNENSKNLDSILAEKAVKIIVHNFDKEFYNQNVKKNKRIEKESNKQKAYSEMCKLSAMQLVDLIEAIVVCRVQKYLFIKSCDVENYMEELTEIGHRINPKIQLITDPNFSGNREELISTLYFAERNELIGVINKYVTKDYLLLIKLIRKCFGNNPISVFNFLEREEI